MKIYKWLPVQKGFKSQAAAAEFARQSGLRLSEFRIEGGRTLWRKDGTFVRTWDVVTRQFVGEFYAEGKTLDRMMPSWARRCFRKPKTIGNKVTKFYTTQGVAA